MEIGEWKEYSIKKIIINFQIQNRNYQKFNFIRKIIIKQNFLHSEEKNDELKINK